MAVQGKTYSFLDTVCSIVGTGGAFSITSGATEEGITFTPRAEKNTLIIGADGAGMHSLHADKSATISVKLLKNSPTNALLSAMYNIQQTSSKFWGKNVITLSSSIGDVITCTGVAFTRQPSVVYAMQGGMNEWQFECIEMFEILAASII